MNISKTQLWFSNNLGLNDMAIGKLPRPAMPITNTNPEKA